MLGCRSRLCVHLMYGVTHIPYPELERLGVPHDEFIEAVDDRMTELQSMEDGARGE